MNERLISTSEVSKSTGVPSYKLRYLHETGKIIPEMVTDGGYRYYRQSQVIDVLRHEKKQFIVAYSCKEIGDKDIIQLEKELKKESEQLASEVSKIITDIKITPMYDIWTGSIEKSNMKQLIEQASQRLVIKIVVRSQEHFIIGDINEYQKWLGYLDCELLDIDSLKQMEADKDADQGQ